jgi:hypothetical protein
VSGVDLIDDDLIDGDVVGVDVIRVRVQSGFKSGECALNAALPDRAP